MTKGVVAAGTGPTPDTQAPSVPGSLTSLAQTNGSIVLSWNSSVDNVSVSGYQINRNGIILTNSLKTNYTDIAVTPGINYSYTINAFDGSGNYSSGSNLSSATALEKVIAVTIIGNNITIKNPTSAVISWTTNMPSTGSVSYGTKNNLSLSGTDTILSPSHAVSLPGLIPNTNYSYRITAVSGDGNTTASSAIINFKTPKK